MTFGASVHTIDLQYLGIPQAVAAFAIVDDRRSRPPILVETGPSSTLVALERGLQALGFALADVRHALVTHIHLDHAGAAGHLAANGTVIHVHEFGAKHLVDPAKLIHSATRIYGEQMQRLWGSIVPVPEHLVRPVHDGEVIEIDGVRLHAMETPGHARHHHAFALEAGNERVCFIGDVGGFNATLASPTYLSVPTPPPEFDLEAWLASIARLRAEAIDALYLTHFGRVDDAAAHLRRLESVLREHVAFVQRLHEQGAERDEILRRYIHWNRAVAQGCGMDDLDFEKYVSRNLLSMNVDGLLRSLSKA